MAYEINQIVVAGRLAKDPEVRYTTGDNPIAVARYTVAVNRGENADFLRCVSLSKQGKFVEKYLRKGSAVAVNGTIQTGQYTNKAGKTVYTTEIRSERVTSEKNGILQMNVAVIEGHLTRDPDIRVTSQGTKTARFTLGVTRPYNARRDKAQDESDFISCVAFNERAEFAEKYLKKGTAVGIVGEVRTGSYNRQDTGEKVYTTDVICDRIRFAASKEQTAAPAAQPQNAPAQATPAAQAPAPQPEQQAPQPVQQAETAIPDFMEGFADLPEGFDDLPFC